MPHDATLEKFATPRDIGTLTSSTPQTVLNWYHAGIIPAAFAVGRIIRFDRNEVLAALAANSRKGREA